MTINSKEWFIEAPWGRISIMAWGNCLDPPVLLCHGRMDCAASFQPLIDLLPQKFYYIALDLPGCGKSDPLPAGLMLNAFDMLYSVDVVVQHFRWEEFVYIGHSLGTLLGKLYILSYPNKISKLIELDPIPMLDNYNPDEFNSWYHKYFSAYYNKYDIMNSSKEKAPSYTRHEALELLKNNRGLPDEAAVRIFDRVTEPAGNGLVRFTFDQRVKMVTLPFFTQEQLKSLYTRIGTHTLTIIASVSLEMGNYERSSFALKEAEFPYKNYRVRVVDGTHDVHIIKPELIAGYVEIFLLYGLEGLDRKSKL